MSHIAHSIMANECNFDQDARLLSVAKIDFPTTLAKNPPNKAIMVITCRTCDAADPNLPIITIDTEGNLIFRAEEKPDDPHT